MVASPVPRMEMASSQTSRNQTLVRVHAPGVHQHVVVVLHTRLDTFAVHTLERVSSDDDVGKACTVFEDEYGVITSSVFVRVARLPTIELLVLEVHAASYDRRFRKRDHATSRGRDVESLRRSKAGEYRCELDLGVSHLG